MKRKELPLWSRLWLAVLLATLLPLVAFLMAGAFLAQRGAENADLESLGRQARLLTAILERQAVQGEAARRSISDAVAGTGRSMAMVPIGDVAGEVSPEAGRLTARGLEWTGRIESEEGLRLVAVVPNGAEALILSRLYEAAVFDWRPWTGIMLLSASLAVVAAIIASLLVAREVTRPVARVARAARRLAAGEPPREVELSGPSELRSLATSFNTMSAELARTRAAEESFLMSVGHELKTPIAAVRGYAEGLEDGAVPVEEASRFIQVEGKRLERLVGDLLDLARMSQSEFQIRPRRVDLLELAESALRRRESQARDLGIDLEISGNSHAQAYGDPDRIVQIISNLLENALRYTPPGGWIRVSVEVGSVEVADSGPGLDPEACERAFERFYLFRRYGDRRPVGTGLGLAIVKQLAEAMNGEAFAGNMPEAGARFVVRLPAGPGAP